jgi:hypothetical protein
MFMVKNNFPHIPYVGSSLGEALQVLSGVVEAKNYVSPNFPQYHIILAIGRTHRM